ncbi:putative capsid protein [mongoose-associated cyclovirus Mon-32]|uniref:Capsid protein n=1 Tax=mongoose-associated cyclovirus Mon-32 TaxID=3070928 RepID=A0AC61TD92_9CIRC|nr:putative capsid protein [Mongoose-associated cyclovirus]UBR88850.1 putative capsid protein [mongoose-associated cyclovirus Mon-32]
MALRRVRRYFKRPLRRVHRRRRMFRRRYTKRSRSTPTLACKLTKTVQVSTNLKTGGFTTCNFQLNDFAEFTNLASNFERVRVVRCRVRVLPHQNVANNSTSENLNYAIVPYHGPITSGQLPNFPTSLSIDRAKVYRMTQRGYMNFVPAIRYSVDSDGGNQTLGIKWRPELYISTAASKEILYTGFINYEGATYINENYASHFTVIMDVFVRFKNQRGFIG